MLSWQPLSAQSQYEYEKFSDPKEVLHLSPSIGIFRIQICCIFFDYNYTWHLFILAIRRNMIPRAVLFRKCLYIASYSAPICIAPKTCITHFCSTFPTTLSSWLQTGITESHRSRIPWHGNCARSRIYVMFAVWLR